MGLDQSDPAQIFAGCEKSSGRIAENERERRGDKEKQLAINLAFYRNNYCPSEVVTITKD